MPMTPIRDTLDILLGLKPKDAIIRMVNDENGTSFPFYAFDISAPVAGPNRETYVTLTAANSPSDEFQQEYQGSFNFTYQRLDLFAQFAGLLSDFRPPLPTSTQVLLDEITRRTGIEFYPEDIVLEDIMKSAAEPYTIKAKPGSYRWIGQVSFNLIETTDIAALTDALLPFPVGPRLGFLDESHQLTEYSNNAHVPNATAYIREVEELEESWLVNSNSDLAQSNPLFVWLVQQVVPTPATRLENGPTPWVCTPTPGPFNLYNATIKGFDKNVQNVSRNNPDLNARIRIELDLDYCTNFRDRNLVIGYRHDVRQDRRFSFKPRLALRNIVSNTDGSQYARFLNGLTVGQIIQSVTPLLLNLTPDGDPWFTSAESFEKTNLFNAVVQYNGQLRAQDVRPDNASLNRVVVMTLNDENSAYRGNWSLFYRAAIVLPDDVPDAFLNEGYSFSLEPTFGTGPFTFTIVESVMPNGMAFNPTNRRLEGDPKTTGVFRLVLDVQDALGLTVRYNYRFSVNVATLGITGKAPNPRIGVPYSYQYAISGGVGPYTFRLGSGQAGPGIFVDPNNALLIGTPSGDPGLRSFVLIARDSRGVETSIADSFFVQVA